MSLFSKLKGGKKKSKPVHPPQTTDQVHPQEVKDILSEESTPPSSPVGHAVQTQSIFSGLHLSSKVALGEAPDSPYTYTKRSSPDPNQAENQDEDQLDEGAPSSFPFLSEVEGELTPDSVKQSEDGTVFSFLGQPVDIPVGAESDVPVDLTSAQEKGSTPSLAVPDSTSEILDTNDPAGKVTKTPQKIAVKQLTTGTSEKKKKRKAIRPGQGMNKEQEPVVAVAEAKGWEPAIAVTKEQEPAVTIEQESAVTVTKEQVTVTKEQEPVFTTTKEQPADTATKEQVLESGHSISPIFSNKNLSSSSILKEESTGKTKTESERTSERVPCDTELMTEEPPCADCASAELSPMQTSGNYTVQFTHEENLAGLLQSYASGVSKIRADLLLMEEVHKAKVSGQVDIAQKQIARWREERLLRDKEAAALAEEDYELAEELNRQLDAPGVETEQSIVSAGLMEVQEWIQECSREKESKVLFQSEMETKLGHFRELHGSVVEELRREQASLLAREKMQVQSLQGEVEREAGHIDLDCSHLEKREQQLAEETSRRAVHFIGKKDQLTRELEDVELEIHHLEIKLTRFRNQREEIMGNILVEEEHIKTIEEEMHEEREQLKSERMSFQERQDKLAVQQMVVVEKQHAVQEMEMKQKEEEGVLEQLTVEATAVWDEVQNAVSLQSQSSHRVQQLLDLLQEGHKLLNPSEELLKAQTSVESKKQEVKKQTEDILVGQNQLGLQRRTVRDLQAQLSEIQESKKVAVTGRQFKEASRLAGESKAMTLRVEEEQENLSEAEQAMAISSKNLALLSDELGILREKVMQLERKEDEAHIQDLLQANNTLSNLCEVLGNNFLRSVLESWKQLYAVAMESLCSKHGLDSTQNTETSEAGKLQVAYEINSEEKTTRLMEIEAEIEKACQDEDYDRAAQLEEELQHLKIASSSSS